MHGSKEWSRSYTERKSRARDQEAFLLNQKIPKTSNKDEWTESSWEISSKAEIFEFVTESKHLANHSGNSRGKNKIERKFLVRISKNSGIPHKIVLFFWKYR